MITAIKELGEHKLKRENRDIANLLSILVQDPNQDSKYPYVLVIIFSKNRDRYTYSRTIIEQTSKSKIEKYLYRRGASNGPNFTPTAKITDINKTFKVKILGWFQLGRIKDPLPNNSKFMLLGIKNALAASEKQILEDLSNKWNEIKPQLNKNLGAIITLAIEENNNIKYLGDYDIFQNLLVQLVKAKYHKIVKSNHICSVCGEKKQEVFGEAIPFAFYTLDKPGFIAGGFNEESAWRNAPICLECSLMIDEGKKFLNENLKYKIGNVDYFLIPKFIFRTEEIEEIINNFFFHTTHPKDMMQTKAIKRITEDEKEILDIFKDYQDVLTYNFLFFSAPNPQVFKINLLVEDILPSRIKTIFDVKSQIEENEVFKNVEINRNKIGNIEFHFDELKNFSPSQEDFLEIVAKIFHGIMLESNLFFSWLMTKIRNDFIDDLNKYNFKRTVLSGLICLTFLENLGILARKQINSNKGGEFMSELSKMVEGIFNDFPNTFPTTAHKCVFLLGVLCQKLLNIQWQERGASPFRKKLKGLKMKENDFKTLFTEIQNKLEEYGKNYYQELETIIADYFIKAGRNWQINADELNFYFVLGMNLVEAVDKKLNSIKQQEV